MVKGKVSVIIPVYNVEKFIGKCVESLIQQEYDDIEIILVDDGSPDKSGIIIDELKTRDKRIITIHQKNSGVSAARNSGLAVATGEYITFVDGDDWVEPNYVAYFIQLLELNHCDIAMNKNNYTEIKSTTNNISYVIDSEKAIEWIYLGDIFVAVWNKMYRKSFLDKNQILFNNEIWFGEGMLFNIECLQYTDSVAIGEKSVYHQTFNLNSAMRKFNLKSNLCGIKSLELQKALWSKKNLNIEKAWRYHCYCFNRNIIDGLVRSRIVTDNKNVYTHCVSTLRNNIAFLLQMEKSVKKKLVWCGYYVSPYLMAIRGAIKFKIVSKKSKKRSSE